MTKFFYIKQWMIGVLVLLATLGGVEASSEAQAAAPTLESLQTEIGRAHV